MKVSKLQFKVHIYDTDCYGVMWHGNYLKWLEQARDALMVEAELDLQMPNEGYVYPVAEQTVRFRKPAKLRDTLEVRTSVEIKGPRLIFSQPVFRLEADGSETLIYESTTVCVVCDADFKPFRRIPEAISSALV
ncbi:MAG: acyl-CoA thioesterase [Vampirovibrionales bacterium]